MVNAVEVYKKMALKLFEIGAFKFGDFTLKSGIKSPVYFDLRVVISYPNVLSQLSLMLSDQSKVLGLKYEQLCGVPYSTLPMAKLMSVHESKPMIICRNDSKSHGRYKKWLEGKYNKGDLCLIVEDVITTGSSVLETVRDLRKKGICVTDAVTLVDREHGGAVNIQNEGVKVFPLFMLSDLLIILKEANKITAEMFEAATKFSASNQIGKQELGNVKEGMCVSSLSKSNNIPTEIVELNRTTMSFLQRLPYVSNPVGKKIIDIILSKQSMLCVAADIVNCADIMQLAKDVGPYICILKLHIDIIDDFNRDFLNQLRGAAIEYNFLIMEDRKFADVGNTIALQYTNGMYRIREWADLVTVHSLPGPGAIKGLQKAINETEEVRAIFLLAELSTAGNLINEEYSENTMKMIADYENCVAGIVCQNPKCVKDVGLLQMTPGVKIGDISDGLGQQYVSPDDAVMLRGADIAVVGRGVVHASDRAAAAKEYRKQLWRAYTNRIADT